MPSLNRVCLSGNLTRDPELRELASGSSVCSLRLAVNTRHKVGEEWTDKAHFIDVTVFGRSGENAAKFLSKGRQVIVDGRLDYREWEKDGQKRNALQVIANEVVFVGGRESGESSGNGGQSSGDDGPLF